MMSDDLLDAAITIWSHDLPISVDHWEALADRGYAVTKLERVHRP